MMTPQQQKYVESLKRRTSHPVTVLDSQNETEERSVTVHLSWPGFYLTISPNGELVDTATEAQYKKANQPNA